MLDNSVAGGLPKGLTVRECLEKEAMEELGIPSRIASEFVYSGSLEYRFQDDADLVHGEMQIFDIRLPKDFEPVCGDGSVAEFLVMGSSELAEALSDRKFKFNCGLVVLDWLLRSSPDALGGTERLRGALYRKVGPEAARSGQNWGVYG